MSWILVYHVLIPKITPFGAGNRKMRYIYECNKNGCDSRLIKARGFIA